MLEGISGSHQVSQVLWTVQVYITSFIGEKKTQNKNKAKQKKKNQNKFPYI